MLLGKQTIGFWGSYLYFAEQNKTLLKLVTCYLLLVTGYWFIHLLVTDSVYWLHSFTGYWFGLLVTDSFTGYWFGLLVTDSDSFYWLLIRLLIHLLVTDSFTGYWFVYWLIRYIIRFNGYWLLIRLLVTDSVYWFWFVYWLLIRVTCNWLNESVTWISNQ